MVTNSNSPLLATETQHFRQIHKAAFHYNGNLESNLNQFLYARYQFSMKVFLPRL